MLSFFHNGFSSSVLDVSHPTRIPSAKSAPNLDRFLDLACARRDSSVHFCSSVLLFGKVGSSLFEGDTFAVWDEMAGPSSEGVERRCAFLFA